MVFKQILPPLSISHMILEEIGVSRVTERAIRESVLNFTVVSGLNEGRLEYSLERAGSVRVDLIDLTGRVIRRILDDNQQSGLHTLTIPLNDLPPGFYIIRLQTPEGIHAAKAIIR